MRSAGTMAADPYLTVSFADPEDVPPWMGAPMSRADALASPRISTVWAITDASGLTVDPIAEQVHPTRRRGRRRWHPPGRLPPMPLGPAAPANRTDVGLCSARRTPTSPQSGSAPSATSGNLRSSAAG